MLDDLEMRLYLMKEGLRQRAVFPLHEATSDLRVLPDYLIVGAQKAGTSSLYEYLGQHPQVVPPFTKEVHHFDQPHAPDGDAYRSYFPTRTRMRLNERLRGGPAVTGEATPVYLFHPHAPRRAAQLVPDARIVAILRDPVDRAWSHYHHEVRFDNEDLSFEEAVAREEERLEGEMDRLLEDPSYDAWTLRHHSYKARGRYAEQLERWLDHFDREQLLVLATSELARDPQAQVDAAAEHLGLPSAEVRPRKRHNEGRYDREMPDDVRRDLEDHFAPHDEALEDLLDRSFPWTS